MSVSSREREGAGYLTSRFLRCSTAPLPCESFTCGYVLRGRTVQRRRRADARRCCRHSVRTAQTARMHNGADGTDGAMARRRGWPDGADGKTARMARRADAQTRGRCGRCGRRGRTDGADGTAGADGADCADGADGADGASVRAARTDTLSRSWTDTTASKLYRRGRGWAERSRSSRCGRHGGCERSVVAQYVGAARDSTESQQRHAAGEPAGARPVCGDDGAPRRRRRGG